MSQNKYISVAGEYICRVELPTAGWFGASKEKGTPFLRIPLVVEDPDSDQDGCRITSEHYITENTLDRLAVTLKETFGFEDLFELDCGPNDSVPRGFSDQYCKIVVEMEDYNGKSYAKVRWLNPVDYQPKRIDPEKSKGVLSQFGARFRAIAKAVKGPATPNGYTPGDTSTETKSNIPF